MSFTWFNWSGIKTKFVFLIWNRNGVRVWLGNNFSNLWATKYMPDRDLGEEKFNKKSTKRASPDIRPMFEEIAAQLHNTVSRLKLPSQVRGNHRSPLRPCLTGKGTVARLLIGGCYNSINYINIILLCNFSCKI